MKRSNDRRSLALPALALALVLGGCGTNPKDRGLGGAAVGAGTGAVVGAVTGLSVLEGAALGGVLGAITGLVTDPDQVNLGGPAWKQGQGGGPTGSSAGNQTVRSVQAGLARLGYDPGPADGVTGPRTAEAIRAYQRDHGLLVDGHPSPALADHIAAPGG